MHSQVIAPGNDGRGPLFAELAWVGLSKEGPWLPRFGIKTFENYVMFLRP